MGNSTRVPMQIQLSLELLRVVEQAAVASARTMGTGDRHKADQAATEAMRQVMDHVPMDGTVVIGEGERDEAPMLFIGEKVGAAAHNQNYQYPAVDIAVDPLEGTNLCATGARACVHAVMGTGGAPEGVLSAAALRCLNGEMLARLVVSKPEHQERLAKMGISDPKRIYETEDLAPGRQIIFACTGVTDGNLLRGVRFFGDGIRTHSLVMNLEERQVRFIDSVHLERRPDVKVRFA